MMDKRTVSNRAGVSHAWCAVIRPLHTHIHSHGALRADPACSVPHTALIVTASRPDMFLLFAPSHSPSIQPQVLKLLPLCAKEGPVQKFGNIFHTKSLRLVSF